MSRLLELEQAFELFESIGNTSSRNDKEDLLKQGKDNTIFKHLLVLTYDPFTVYGIKKDPKVKPIEGNNVDLVNYGLFVTLLEDLGERRLTGNKAIEGVKSFLSNCSEREYEWYMKIIKRDLKIGITAKTINKKSVMNGLIPVFVCALANTINMKKIPEEYCVDRKYDGYRCLAFNRGNGVVELFSRNGKEILGYDNIEEDIKLLPEGFIYDGEIMDRSGEFSGVQKSAFKKSTGKDGILYIFDMVDIEEFESNNFTVPYRYRLKGLHRQARIIDESNNLELVESRGVYHADDTKDWESVRDFYEQVLEEGLEGIMVKDLNAVYKMDKSNNIMKLKPSETDDFTITGVYEGREGTKYEGMMGGVYVQYKNNPYQGIGGGWSDEQREYYWREENKQDLINRVIEVEHEGETKDSKTGLPSVRFARFKRFRPDKE